MNELTEIIYQRGIADVTRDIRAKTGEFLRAAIEIGRLLFEAKAMVEPGGWSRYIEEELPFSHSWANNYMKLYTEFGSDQTSLFGDSQAYMNLRPSQALEIIRLPEGEREEFMETHNVENMSSRQLKAAIDELKETKADLQAAEEATAEIRKKLAVAESALQDSERARMEADARAEDAKKKLAEAQLAAKIQNPDLLAINALGKQVLSTWNTIQGHKKKAVAADPANAAPIDAFLKKLLEAMNNG